MRKNNKKGFSLIELIIAITILGIIATILYSSFDSNGSNDKVRDKSMEEAVTLLGRFQGDYGVYPNASGTSKDYPAGCAVSGWDSLMSCFVAVGYLNDKADDYLKISQDPVEGSKNDQGKKYTYFYGSDTDGNKFKVCFLPYKQSGQRRGLGLDGNSATAGNIYKCSTSPKTAQNDITNPAE